MNKKNQEKKKRMKEKSTVEEKNAQPKAGDTPVEQEPEATESVSLSKEEFEQVKAHIETLQKEKDSTVELTKRLQADFDNYRKRNASIRMDSLREGERDVIKSLLPVLDNFDRALLNSEGVDPGFVNGVGLVKKQMWDALSRYGLEEIPADGKFDPTLHDAVAQEEVEGKENGDITEVLLKGYKVKTTIIRHTMVKVAK